MTMTAEMLLKNKKIIEERTAPKEITVKLKSLVGKVEDPTIKIKSLDFDEMSKIEQESGGDKVKMDILTCYNAVIEPVLKDKKLQEGFECKTNPHGIVEKLFEKQEIMFISGKVAKLSGYRTNREDDVIEEIKNE